MGELAIDLPARVVTVRGGAVHLAGKEFELLAALASEPNRVFTKDELLRDVWGYRSFTRTRTLDSHVSRLRSKLERQPGDRFVVNVWGGWATSSSTDYASGRRRQGAHDAPPHPFRAPAAA